MLTNLPGAGSESGLRPETDLGTYREQGNMFVYLQGEPKIKKKKSRQSMREEGELEGRGQVCVVLL